LRAAKRDRGPRARPFPQARNCDRGYFSPIAPGQATPWLDAGTGRERLGLAAILLLPGALTLFFGFQAGGFFPGSVGVSVLILCVALGLRIGLAGRPLEGMGAVGLVVVAALAGFAIWTLASAAWSGSVSRAVLEFDRALAYMLAFVLLGSVATSPSRRRLALYGVAGALVLLCAAGFASRVAPDLLGAPSPLNQGRLSYPLSYWNAVGLACALAIVLCAHIGSAPGARVARALGTATLPLLGATLLLTFSRGALIAVVVGVVAYVVLARERGVLAAALAGGPTAFVALGAAYDADLLGTARFASEAGQAQGRHLATVVLIACAVAFVLRLALTFAESRTAHIARLEGRRGLSAAIAGSLVLLTVAAFFIAGGPGRLGEQWRQFKEGDGSDARLTRDRLTQVGNNGRIDEWNVAREAFGRHRLNGSGAGTFAVLWARERPTFLTVNDAHSLPLEVAAELGIVGVALLGVALLGLLGGVMWRARGPDRAAFAVVAAAGAAWLARACIDWDWEMPSLTMWVFALGGLALARPVGRSRVDQSPVGQSPAPAPRIARVVAILVVGLLAVLPVQAALSQARLDNAVEAFKAGGCDEAVDESLASAGALPARPEPFQVLAFCDARRGQSALAIEVARKAVERDPDNWEFPYSLAIVQAYAGRDPREAAARALALNPKSRLTRDAVRRFRTSDSGKWRKRAQTAPLPFQ